MIKEHDYTLLSTKFGRNDTLKFIKIDTRNRWEDGDGSLNCFCVCMCITVKQGKQSKSEIIRFF